MMSKLMLLILLFSILLICGCIDEQQTQRKSSDQSTSYSPENQNGCQYNNPPCSSDYICVDNFCIKKNGCQFNNPSCNEGFGCINNLCVQNKKKKENYNFTYYENTEPYLSAYCDKINPYDLGVREAASDAIRENPGKYSMNQLLDIYDWVKRNIIYQTVPLAGIPYVPSETLATKSGDCKNQAVLIASMVRSIGGTAKVVADPDCVHAYAIVYFGTINDLSSFTQAVSNHYGSGVDINYFTMGDGIWVIFDPAGGQYPGDTLSACSGNRNVYFITSCLDCANIYSDKPYSFNGKCYSKCPSGTITKNNHACFSCPAGYSSLNNQCFSCPQEYVLGEDGSCHETCGDSTTYCITGTCFNNRCVTCPEGNILGQDGNCHKTCGSPNIYCITGTCFNGQCLTCPSGQYLATDGRCYWN